MTGARARISATVVAALVASGLASVGATLATAPAVAAEAAAPRDGLVAEYLFDETTGTLARNSADGSTTGTDPLDATVRQSTDAQWRGGSLQLTGGAKNIGSWVELPDGLLAGDEQATITTEVWADPAMLRTFHFLWNIGSDATDRYLFSSLNCGNNRRPLVGVKGAAGEQLVQASTCAATAGRWMSVTAVVDGTTDTARLYVDGVQVAQGAVSASPVDVTNQSLNTIGRAPWPDPLFKGEVGAFRVYDRVLSASEVSDVSTADAIEHAEALNQAAAGLLVGITDRTVNGDTTLATQGGAVTWTSSAPDVVSAGGEVTQPPTGSEPVAVQLTARAAVRGQAAEKTMTVTVLPEAADDDPYGYAMVHFIEDSQGYAEKIYLDVSRDDDPTHWLPLNDGKPILASNLGTTGVRDPYLTYNPETKTWYIIATDLRVFGGDNAGWGAWSSRGSLFLNVWESKDLVEWSDLRQVKVSPPTAGMSWAPEATWVPELGEFVVYWASTLYAENNPQHTGSAYSRILYGTTSDFTQEDFSYRGPMIDTGANVIDTTVIQDGGTTYRISKDNGTGRGVYMERTTATEWWEPTTAWTQLQANIGQADYGSVEGPAVFKDHQRDHWYLYVDVIPSIGYRPYETSDLDDGWTRLDPVATGFTMTPSTKHGGIVSLTKGQLDEVREADVAELLTQEVAVSTPGGTAPVLPATAEVKLENGDRANVPVAWEPVDPADDDAAGTFTVEGTVKAIGNNLNEAAGVGVPLTSSTAIDNVVTATVTVRGVPVTPPATPPGSPPVAPPAGPSAAAPSSTTTALKVRVLGPPGRQRQRVKLRVTVTAGPSAPAGAVRLWDGKRLLRTVTLTAGRVMTTARLRGTGVHRLRAEYVGSPTAAPSIDRVRVRIP